MSPPTRDTMGPVSAPAITAEDVLRHGSPWRACEIWDGLPMVREPSGGWSEAVGARVIVRLGAHVEAADAGFVFLSSQGFLLARDPDRLLAPDGAFISKERLERIPRRGFIELAPDFLIEVRSPEQSWEETVEKCGVWIAHGARCAWAIDPERKRVAVLRPARAPEVLRGTGRASADPALPEFGIDLATLFGGFE